MSETKPDAGRPRWGARALRAPTRVELSHSGGSLFELRPLDAFGLVGKLFAAGLEALDPEATLGVPADDSTDILLWVQALTGGGFHPQPIQNRRELARKTHELREAGTPYFLTLTVFTDPLAPPRPKPED